MPLTKFFEALLNVGGYFGCFKITVKRFKGQQKPSRLIQYSNVVCLLLKLFATYYSVSSALIVLRSFGVLGR